MQNFCQRFLASCSRLGSLWFLFAAIAGCSSETARWEFAQAQRLADQGESEKSIELMKVAVAKSGEHWELALPFALELAKRGDPESIEICDRLLNQEVIQHNAGRLKYARDIKIDCQSHLGDFSGALVTLKSLHRDRVIRSETEENRLAYIRALAGEELELAYHNINSAIGAVATEWCCGERLDMTAKTVVASALLSRFFYDESRKDNSIEPLHAAEERLLETATYLSHLIEAYESKYGSIIGCVETGDTTAINLERCTARSNLVVLLIVRALVYQDLGKLERSNRDRFQASQMSQSIEKVVQGLPNERSCLELLSYASAFLDTRGFIQSQLPWVSHGTTNNNSSSYQETLNSLNAAILACQIERRALRGTLFNYLNFPVAAVSSLQQFTNRSEAVLRYHRMLTHQRAGNLHAQRLDREAIIELGFEPGKTLF